ncbi:MAG TPA: ribosomal-processing cysteine protease Prp [Firmicutes bacterium]|nr:ribosomal-processing cysteine protease Prp [Bacillota bacterium]
MITASFNYKNNKVNSFEISGHAFAGEPGEDLVCAGVSAVSFGLTNSIINLDESELTIKMEDGYLLVENIPSSHEAQILIGGMITSLQTIEEDHFQYITVIENK